MSMDEKFMEPEDESWFVYETMADDCVTFFGNEGAEFGICPYIVFYIFHDYNDFLPLCDEIIELYQEFRGLVDEPFSLCYNSKTCKWVKATKEKMSREFIRAHAELHAKKGEPFTLGATDLESAGSSARWAIFANVTGNPEKCYTTVKLTFRDKWYRTGNNSQIWQGFVRKWIGRLQPEQCYSGYEIGTTTMGGTYESDVMDRIFADHFYGMDIDHPEKMGFHDRDGEDRHHMNEHLGAGLRPPTWCFLLSPLWRSKLGKSVEEVKEALLHPDILIDEVPYTENPIGEPALWVRLGDLNLYHVGEGRPELPMIANKLILPVRNNLLRLYAYYYLDVDINPRFDGIRDHAWIGRFDEDSDWPDKDKYMPYLASADEESENGSYFDPDDLYLNDEETEEFIAETLKHNRDHEMYSYGLDNAHHGVCPFITFYIYGHDRDAVVEEPPPNDEASLLLIKEAIEEAMQKVAGATMQVVKDAFLSALGGGKDEPPLQNDDATEEAMGSLVDSLLAGRDPKNSARYKDVFLPLCSEVIEMYQDLQALTDDPFLRCYDSSIKDDYLSFDKGWMEASPEMLGRDFLLECAESAAKDGNRPFRIQATSEESAGESALWAISACVTNTPWNHYTTVKITFRDSWYHKENNHVIWQAFVRKWIKRLQPEQCYSGYEIGTTTNGITDAENSDIVERIFAGRFYGLDVDHPRKMGSHSHENDIFVIGSALGAGLRTPTWSFLLSPLWLSEMEKSIGEVKAELSHQDIYIAEIPFSKGWHNPEGNPALWIQLGELSLYPVDEGRPELPMIAGKLIRPIRCDHLQLFTLTSWEDRVNPRFNEESSRGWMARFDENSKWPVEEFIDDGEYEDEEYFDIGEDGEEEE